MVKVKAITNGTNWHNALRTQPHICGIPTKNTKLQIDSQGMTGETPSKGHSTEALIYTGRRERTLQWWIGIRGVIWQDGEAMTPQ